MKCQVPSVGFINGFSLNYSSSCDLYVTGSIFQSLHFDGEQMYVALSCTQ